MSTPLLFKLPHGDAWFTVKDELILQAVWGDYALLSGVLQLSPTEHMAYISGRGLADRMQGTMYRKDQYCSPLFLLRCVFPPLWQVPFRMTATVGMVRGLNRDATVTEIREEMMQMEYTR